MVCTHVDLCIYQGEGASGTGTRNTKVHCTIYFNPSVMIAFSTSIQNLIISSLKLLVQVIQLKFHLILRVAFHGSHPFFSSPSQQVWGPHWLGKELCPLPEKNEGKNSTLKETGIQPENLLPPNKSGQTEMGGREQRSWSLPCHSP